jgi:hypothetical protein
MIFPSCARSAAPFWREAAPPPSGEDRDRIVAKIALVLAKQILGVPCGKLI